MERITTPKQAKKYIGQTLRWCRIFSGIWCESVLREVVGKNVRLDHDWQWLPDIILLVPIQTETPTPLTRTMEVCPNCGNKRCPHATDPALPCTGSNEPDQPGSRYTTPTTGAPES